MAKYFIVLFICITVGITEANFPIEYSADAGDPVDATAIESPTEQGWNESATGDGVVTEGIVDGGVNSWRLLDNASNLGPKYSIALTADDFQIMYDYGWEFTYVCKPTTSGGGWVGWGISSANNPGWDIGSTDRVGFGVYVSGTGTIVINPQHGAAIDLGEGSQDSFHEVKCVGGARSSKYEFFINGEHIGTYGIKDGGSNSSTANQVQFMSGSTGGTGREVYWNYVQLKLGAFVLTETDGMTEVAEGLGSDSYSIELLADPNEAANPRYPRSSVDVTITAGSEILVNGQSETIVTFPSWTGDPNDYVITVNVEAINDDDVEGPDTVIIRHEVSSADLRWGNEQISDLLVDVIDDDGTPGVEINKTTVFVSEDGVEDSYTIVLGTPPKSPVTIELSTDSQIVEPNDIIFDDSNWAIPQAVTITAIDDAEAEGSHGGTVTHSVVSADPTYNGMSVATVAVDITDNEPQGPGETIPFAWYMADAGTVIGHNESTEADHVVQWMDQSGNGRNLNQTSGDGPQYQPDGGDGKPALKFVDNDDALYASPADWGSLPQPATIFVVGMFDDNTNAEINAQFFSGRAGSTRMEMTATRLGNGQYWQMYAGAALSNKHHDGDRGNRLVHTCVFNGEESKHYMNSVLDDTGNAGDFTMEGLTVGNRYSFSQAPDGQILEFIAYSGLLSEAEQAQVEEYLELKWLGRVAVYAHNGYLSSLVDDATVVTEGDATADSYDVSVFGERSASVDVIATPSNADIDLGGGAGNAVLVTFEAGSGAATQSISVSSVDNVAPDGPRVVNVSHSSLSTDGNYDGLSISEIPVTVLEDEQWCGQDGTLYLATDLNQDCYVTLADFAILASNWLGCTDPFYPGNCDLELP